MSRHTIYNCDYRDRLDLLLNEYGKFDCMVMDPPYVIDTKGAGKFRNARSVLEKITERGLDQGFDMELLSWKYANSIVVFCHNDQLGEIIIRLSTRTSRPAMWQCRPHWMMWRGRRDA